MQVYPCYIDGTKTVAEGRRIPKELACKKQPWAKDIVEALKELQLSQAFEVIPTSFFRTHQFYRGSEAGGSDYNTTRKTKHRSYIVRLRTASLARHIPETGLTVAA